MNTQIVDAIAQKFPHETRSPIAFFGDRLAIASQTLNHDY
jgi:hypothetical protein